tara:strand:- start:10 stop:555 length:546 start_codon:yes stop_codon:yes gene_type:complete
MAFWGNINSQPKRQHRFALTFGKRSGQDQLPQWIVSTVTRPSMNIDVEEHQYLNHTFKFPGRAKWNNINVTMKDPLVPDASKELFDILDAAGYAPPAKSPADPSMKEAFTKKKFVETIGTIRIDTLNNKGEPIETWTLYNPMFVSVEWGQFDYASEGLIDLSVEIAYDYATIEVNSANERT